MRSLEKGFYVYCNNGEDKHRLFVDENQKIWSIRQTCRYEFYLCDWVAEVYGGYFDTKALIEAFENDMDETHFEYKGLEYQYMQEHYSTIDYKHYNTPITLRWNNDTNELESEKGEDIFLYQEK